MAGIKVWIWILVSLSEIFQKKKCLTNYWSSIKMLDDIQREVKKKKKQKKGIQMSYKGIHSTIHIPFWLWTCTLSESHAGRKPDFLYSRAGRRCSKSILAQRKQSKKQMPSALITKSVTPPLPLFLSSVAYFHLVQIHYEWNMRRRMCSCFIFSPFTVKFLPHTRFEANLKNNCHLHTHLEQWRDL